MVRKIANVFANIDGRQAAFVVQVWFAEFVNRNFECEKSSSREIARLRAVNYGRMIVTRWQKTWKCMRYAVVYVAEISSPTIRKDLPLDGSDLSIRHSNAVFVCGCILGENTIATGFRVRRAYENLERVPRRFGYTSWQFAWFFQNIRRDDVKRIIEILSQIVKATSFFVIYKKVYYKVHTALHCYEDVSDELRLFLVT